MLLQFIVSRVRHIHRSFTQHFKMFVPQSAIVTHTHRFPTHCTYEAGGARARPRRPRASALAQLAPTGSLSQFMFPQLVPPLPKRPLLSPTEDTTSWRLQGGIYRSVRTVPRAPLSLSQPLHMTQQSTAAGAEPFCFHSQRMTLSSFIASEASQLVQRSCRDRYGIHWFLQRLSSQ